VSGPRPVLVDCDPALLTWGLDVDDDLALLFLLGSPEIDVVAVTTAYGNTASALCHRDARRLLALAGRSDIPVHRGAGWLSRNLRPTDASRAIVGAARRWSGELTILALAPPTNLAAALAEEPRLGEHLKELVLMGGRATDGLKEFNFAAHPSASRAALGLGCRTVKLTRELCASVAIASRDARLFDVPGSLVARFVPRLARFARLQALYRAYRRGEPGEARGGFHPWDVIAAAWLVAPDLFGDLRELHATVDDRGRVRLGPAGWPVLAPHSLDARRFLDLFVERVTSVSGQEEGAGYPRGARGRARASSRRARRA